MAKQLKDFSLIDKNLTIDGTVQCKGRLIINGVLKGTLVGEQVIIAKEGAVFADARQPPYPLPESSMDRFEKQKKWSYCLQEFVPEVCNATHWFLMPVVF